MGSFHQRRRRPRHAERPGLSIEQILHWADTHHRRTGQWPRSNGGEVAEAPGETWRRISDAFRKGGRSLPKGHTLARLLVERRGARIHLYEPRLTEQQILKWADARHRRSGAWPHQKAGRIAEAPEETWDKVDKALNGGLRGLSAGYSLAKLLERERGVRNTAIPPRLTQQRVLGWADAWYRRTGRWPYCNSGPIPDSGGETWLSLDKALRAGSRGLREVSSLANFLELKRGAPNRLHVVRLSEAVILQWADDHFRRNGRWPTEAVGPIAAAPAETWSKVASSLRVGQRGLPGGDSLACLLERRRGVRDARTAPRLTVPQILAWADAHYHRRRRWPNGDSGPVHGASGEHWRNIQAALAQGTRGLPGGTTLARVLARERGAPHQRQGPRLSVELVLRWADAHYRKHGRWPTVWSGVVDGATEHNWQRIDAWLRAGRRGLPAGLSVARLLDRYRRVR